MDQCDQKQLFDRFCVEQFKDRHDKTSKTISREKGQRIVNVIKKDPSSAVTYSSQFKFWVKKKRFELINHPALELKLFLPAKNSGNVTKHSRLHVHHSRVPHMICNILTYLRVEFAEYYNDTTVMAKWRRVAFIDEFFAGYN